MAEAAFDLLALADAALARRSRVHVSKGHERLNIFQFASTDVRARLPAGSPAVSARPQHLNKRPLARISTRAFELQRLAACTAHAHRLEFSYGAGGQVVADANHLIACWVTQAASLGWRTLDLFGVHPDCPGERFDAAGLVWCMRSGEIVAITPDAARLRTAGRALQTYVRRNPVHPEAVALWDLK